MQRQRQLVSSATVCINIVLNAIFIYGTFGIPSMGVQGAALATLLRQNDRADLLCDHFLPEGATSIPR